MTISTELQGTQLSTFDNAVTA